MSASSGVSVVEGMQMCSNLLMPAVDAKRARTSVDRLLVMAAKLVAVVQACCRSSQDPAGSQSDE